MILVIAALLIGFISLMVLIIEPVLQVFSKNFYITYQSELEQYISQSQPKNTWDVERLMRDYDKLRSNNGAIL